MIMEKGAFWKNRQKLQTKFAGQILQQNFTNLSQIHINKGNLWTLCYMQQAVANEPQIGKQWQIREHLFELETYLNWFWAKKLPSSFSLELTPNN